MILVNVTELEIRNRVREILAREVGEVEEQLLSAGIIDSLRSVEVALSLEEEFKLPMGELTVADLATVSTLVSRIQDLSRRTAGAPR